MVLKSEACSWQAEMLATEEGCSQSDWEQQLVTLTCKKSLRLSTPTPSFFPLSILLDHQPDFLACITGFCLWMLERSYRALSPVFSRLINKKKLLRFYFLEHAKCCCRPVIETCVDSTYQEPDPQLLNFSLASWKTTELTLCPSQGSDPIYYSVSYLVYLEHRVFFLFRLDVFRCLHMRGRSDHYLVQIWSLYGASRSVACIAESFWTHDHPAHALSVEHGTAWAFCKFSFTSAGLFVVYSLFFITHR